MRNFLEERKIHSETLGFDLGELEQGTENWHTARAGVVTASKASLLLMGRDTQGRKTYIDELVASVATGQVKEEITAKALQWGKDYEQSAQDAYSAATFETVINHGFIYMDDSMRAGISPDGIISGQSKGLELKCPYSSGVWAGFAGRGFIKKEEAAQVQFSLLATDFDKWAFAKFDPRNIYCKKLHHIEIGRDEKMITKLRDGLESFIEDMDESLQKLGLNFGTQWES